MQVSGFNAQNLENAELLRSGLRRAVQTEQQKMKAVAKKKKPHEKGGLSEDNGATTRKSSRTLDIIKASANKAQKK